MAKVRIPTRISEVNIYIAGIGHLGLVESMPVLIPKTKKETQGRVHVDTGLPEPQEIEYELRGITEELVFEIAKLHEASVTGKGSYKDNGIEKGAVVEYVGSLDVDMDSWKSGDGQSVKVKQYPNAYSLELDGKNMIDVDELNMTAKIGNVDIYEKVRRNV